MPSHHGHGGDEGRDLAKNATVAKKPRKKRETKIKSDSANKSSNTEGKESGVKVRKARNPSGTASSSTVGRKKKTVEGGGESRFGHGQHLPRHTPTPTPNPRADSLPAADRHVPATRPVSAQNGNYEGITRLPDPPPNLSASMPRSTSGQNYDPIRSATVEPRIHSPRIGLGNGLARSATPPRPPAPRYNSASASPSIASLIEPPLPNHAPLYPLAPKHAAGDRTAPSSPTAKRPRLSPPPVQIHHPGPPDPAPDGEPTTGPAGPRSALIPTADVVSSLAPSGRTGTLVKRPSGGGSTAPSSTSHSPKPSRHREPLVPAGNGLLSSAIFGGAEDGTGLEKNATTVVLHVPLNGCSNLVINFAELAEKKYGFNALYPRLGAHRARLARVAAAGAALENAHKGARHSGSGLSADEMSLDLSDGLGDDSNVEMGGMGMDRDGNGVPTNSDGGVKKKVPKKRMMKEDQYDKQDPFVDDTELAWEEQAAASRDGFFVYSGPLVPEGEKAVVER